uniref:Uncharacterized protein n=1 Tax=Nelumbo nucifera TaxID=4432 RepID=A0A822YW24_NELNU|nr:TPA_asm: hypothetical protein HUJ06_005586 [Nelumbo nucifera]
MGCTVTEMLMHKSAWKCGSNTEISALLF